MASERRPTQAREGPPARQLVQVDREREARSPDERRGRALRYHLTGKRIGLTVVGIDQREHVALRDAALEHVRVQRRWPSTPGQHVLHGDGLGAILVDAVEGQRGHAHRPIGQSALDLTGKARASSRPSPGSLLGACVLVLLRARILARMGAGVPRVPVAVAITLARRTHRHRRPARSRDHRRRPGYCWCRHRRSPTCRRA